MASQIDQSEPLLTKKQIARRYGVSVRTITEWMSRRLIPHMKVSHKIVRFDREKCDIAVRLWEIRSVFDREIRSELDRRRTQSMGTPKN